MNTSGKAGKTDNASKSGPGIVSKAGVRTSAVLVAAGRGSRMGGDVKKQFLELEGVSILERTLAVFASLPEIYEIVLVVGNDDFSFCEQKIVSKYTSCKSIRLVSGGANRQKSVYAGVLATSAATQIVVVHDGVRPFIEPITIRAAVQVTAECGAACVAVPVVETVKRVYHGTIDSTPDRKDLWLAQTPQCFRRELFLRAMAEAERVGFIGTDDASLVERLGEPIAIVEGSYDNIKVTTKKDLELAGVIARRMSCPLPG